MNERAGGGGGRTASKNLMAPLSIWTWGNNPGSAGLVLFSLIMDSRWKHERVDLHRCRSFKVGTKGPSKC